MEVGPFKEPIRMTGPAFPGLSGESAGSWDADSVPSVLPASGEGAAVVLSAAPGAWEPEPVSLPEHPARAAVTARVRVSNNDTCFFIFFSFPPLSGGSIYSQVVYHFASELSKCLKIPPTMQKRHENRTFQALDFRISCHYNKAMRIAAEISKYKENERRRTCLFWVLWGLYL
jgi:hypothetical protein